MVVMPDNTPDKLNPGDLHAAEQFGNPPKKTTDGDKSGGSEDLRGAAEAAESQPGWKNAVTGAAGAASGLTVKKVWKTNGPTAIVLMFLLFGGVGLGGLLSGGSLLLNLKELLSTNLMDAIPTVNEIRARSLLTYKLQSEATSGVCSPITIRCKFKTMGDRQIAKLEKAGIKVNTLGDKGSLSRRTKVTSFEFTDPQTKVTKTITANNLISEMRANPNFASALQKGYNSRYAAWSSSAFESLAKRVQLNRQKNLAGVDEETNQKNLRENASGARATQLITGLKPIYDDSNPPKITGYVDDATGATIGIDEAEERIRAKVPELKDVIDNKKIAADAGNNALKVTGAALKGSLLIGTGLVDSGCTGWTIVRAAGYAAKYFGALQLIRYANTFLNTADAIKAGDATPEEVEFLANIILDENAAGVDGMESRGFNYVAYGDATPVPELGEAARIGSTPNADRGVTITDDAAKEEELKAEVTNYVNGQITSDTIMAQLATAAGQGGATTEAVDATCGFIKSGPGQAVVIGVGAVALAACVAVNILPVLGQVASGSCLGANAIISGSIAITIAVVLNIITPQLIAAATDTIITGNENGNEAINAVVSGSGALNAQNGLASGLGTVSPADAAVFDRLSEEVHSDFAAIDRVDHNPLDYTNGNTFMGKFANMIRPAAVQLSSVSGGLTSISSVLSTSFASLFPAAKAKSYGDAGVCKDPDLKDVATDINCNPLVGQTQATLDLSIDSVLDFMIGGGYVSESSGKAIANSEYDKFTKVCFERTSALGSYAEGTDLSQVAFESGDVCQDGTGDRKYDMFRAYRTFYLVSEGMDDEVRTTSRAGSTIVSPVAEGFVMSSDFGPRDRPCPTCPSWHKGIDVYNTSNPSVYAIMDGVVTSIDDPGGNNAVNIKHADGLISAYLHMYSKDILVKPGDVVTAGQKIGIMGSSGLSTGVHLHFEIDISQVDDREAYINSYIVNTGGNYIGKRIDPQDYLSKNGVPGY